ncbi:MalY/PatB family protein [uncultured Tessaracoccus sp.]|uniref:MalY/PatB family protein n=1 Tax=uncultured Tessaracoccus sp. TaxID=905023 RepID=UPI002603B79D|nr:aminotransferase class I/II-fold pyridoxal phosphate-dependent enzyme [uncultured Tessaracoccus sp.]
MAIFDVPLDELRRRTSIKWTRFEPDVLPMFVAEMDCRVPEPVAQRIEQALRDGDTGYPEQPIYREAFADFAEWRWGWTPNLANATRSGDVMQGMRYAIEAVTAPGDRVVFNPPIYPPFRQIINGTARTPVEVPLVDDRLDFDGLDHAFADGARAYLLCSPHNPNGTVHTLEELAQVAELARRHDVTVIVDEIHAPFNGAEFTPFLALDDPGKAIVSTSAAKAFNLAGLKAGLLFASDAAADALHRMPSYVGEAMSHFGALAHTAALTHCREWLVELQGELERNRRLFADLLSEHLPMLRYEPAEGTYLAWLDCTPLGIDSPGALFHEQGRVRFNFGADFAPETAQWVRVNLATSREIIEEGIRRMSVAVNVRNS